MKKLFVAVFVLALTLALSLKSFAAFDRSKLENAYQSLQQDLNEAHFNEGNAMNAYRRELSDTAKILANTSAGEEELEKAYDELRIAYVNLCLATFDYADLLHSIEIYNSLSPALYTESSWAALSNAIDAAQEELYSPLLYTFNNAVDTETYRQRKQTDIDAFTNAIKDAFDDLIFTYDPETISKEELAALTTHLAAFIQTDYLTGEHARSFLNAMERAERLIDRQNPAAKDLQEAADDLNESLAALLRENLDFRVLEQALEKLNSLSENDYTQSSWSQFQSTLNEMEDALSYPLILAEFSSDSREAYLESYQNLLQKKAELLLETDDKLVSRSLYMKLQQLCLRHANVETDPRAAVYAQRLEEAVKQGNALLETDAPGADELKEVIDAIETASSALFNAEQYFAEEDLNAQLRREQQRQTILLVVFSVVAVVISLVAAVYFSYRKFGKISWNK